MQKTKRKQTLGRKPVGPVPPPGGRVRITINLPMALLKVAKALPGKSLSDKICGAVERSPRK